MMLSLLLTVACQSCRSAFLGDSLEVDLWEVDEVPWGQMARKAVVM